MHKSIPISRDVTALLLGVEQVVRHIPRYHKYTPGSEIRRYIYRLLIQSGRIMSKISHQHHLLAYGIALIVAMLASESLAFSCANENTAITATTEHLVDNNNGTITDPKTGLIWKKCSEDQSWDSNGNACTGTALTYNWQLALERAVDVNMGSTGEALGSTDWRVPNINELASIVELRCDAPAINQDAFPNTPSSRVWSSSLYAPNAGVVWVIDFDAGFSGAFGGDDNRHVRLVRSGQ